MANNVLKKEFKSADVQRLRNLMTGKQGERTNAGIGYSKKQEFHEEGDVWEEDHIVSYKYPRMYALKRPTWEINPTRSINLPGCNRCTG